MPSVDPALLDPRSTWGDPAASMFRENFASKFTADVDPAVTAAGPHEA